MEDRFPRSHLQRLRYLPIYPHAPYDDIQLRLEHDYRLKKPGFLSLTSIYVVSLSMLRLLTIADSGNQLHLDENSFKIVIDRLEDSAPAFMRLARPPIPEITSSQGNSREAKDMVKKDDEGNLCCLIPGCAIPMEPHISWQKHLESVHPQEIEATGKSSPMLLTWDASSSEELVCW